MIKPVLAHCDVPCGVYEVDTLKTASLTCLKLVEQAQQDLKDDQNKLVRLVLIKEEQASLCKQQIYILWSDFFKAPDFEDQPDLHNKLWQAAKACSAVKQSLKIDPAKKLIQAVDQIVSVFEETQKKRS